MKHFKLFINNEWVDAEGGKTFETKNPCTGETIATLASASKGDTAKAVEAAHAAFESGCWSMLDRVDRSAMLLRVADILERRLEEFARWESMDVGKPIRESRSVDIRTIVFLAGCTMRCMWCQNPETLGSGAPTVMVAPASCSGCGACVEACSSGALRAGEDGAVFDRSVCLGCFACVQECYFGARKVSSESMDADSVFAEIMKDEAFYRSSGGGLTLSGGEPLMQIAFSRELLERTAAAGIHTAVETAGNVPREAFEAVIPHTRLFLFDIKAMDDETHRRATGVSNEAVLANLAFVAGSAEEIIVRVPLVPGVNDGAEFDAVARHAASLEGIRELHILPYHSIGASKYEQLGLAYPAENTREDNEEETARCADAATRLGLRVSVGGGGFSAPPDGER